MIIDIFNLVRFKREGQALLLSLLILASVSAAGIGFATVIINLIQAAENIDNSVTAFYASRSGMEQSLYQVKTIRQAGGALDTAVNNIQFLDETTFTTPGLTVEIVDDEVQSEELKQIFFLPKDKSEQIDLYDPDRTFGWWMNPVIKYLWISWDNNPCDFGAPFYTVDCDLTPPPQCCIGRGDEWVEISWTGWNAAGDSFENVEKILLSSRDLYYDEPDPHGYGTCPETGGIQCAHILLDVFPHLPDEIFFYQVRVKALYNKIDNLEVKALDVDHDVVSIQSRLHLKTVGKFGRSQQALSASLPWRFPTSGIFDYVIFAETNLKKIPSNP